MVYSELLKFQSLNNRDIKFQIVNFGTGMGFYDFNYEGICESAFNFALTQQTLEFDYKLLNFYSNLLEKGCYVCLVLPFCIFCANSLEETRELYARYYKILPAAEVEVCCGLTYEEYCESFRTLDTGNLVSTLNRALSNEDMYVQSVETIKTWERQLQLVSCQSGIVSPYAQNEIRKTKEWLRNIFRLCSDKGFWPVVIVPPMSHILLEMIAPSFRESHFYNILDEIVPNTVPIIDYTREDYFCNPEFYGWPGFLIEDAAKEFTKDVLKKLSIYNSGV